MKTRKFIPEESRQAKRLRRLIQESYDLIEKIKRDHGRMVRDRINRIEHLDEMIHSEIGECEIF